MTTARGKFQKLLRELFQIEAAAELDFGIYRIMGQKRGVIERFIDQELLAVIESELKTGELREEANVASQLVEKAEQIRENIDDDAIDAEGQLDPAHQKTKLGRQYLALQQKAAGAQSSETREATIYNHLYHFFSRYYDNGDFMSLRRYSKREKYAIPYNGEEVYLHWANADQYYIKTGETLTDYRWKGPSGNVRVRFTVTRANVPKDNIKAPDKRYFLPQPSDITVETVGKAKDKSRHTLITVPFHYRGLTASETETWETVAAERKLSSINGKGVNGKGGNHNGGKLQAAILAKAHDELSKLASIVENPDALATLIGAHHNDTDGNPISRLAHHLRRFTVKNTSDYFIHKDLGGFLTRELDFYLKNEVLQLDALEAGGEARAEGWFQLMQVIRRIGGTIIAFLAQIENFQKRLFEKKKFVTECHYCLTLDRVPKSLYPEIAKNKQQIAEWKKLFAIDEVEGWSDPPTVKFLQANGNLLVDTGFFEDLKTFRSTLFESSSDLEDYIDGIIIEGDNSQILPLLSETFNSTIKSIYIDPPYNLGDDEFIYKDNYQHSSWISMLVHRMKDAATLLNTSGAIYTSIDDNEYQNLWHALSSVFGKENYVGSFVWKRRSASGLASTPISLDHEYILVFGKNKGELKLYGLEKSQDDYPYFDEKTEKHYASTDLSIGATREQRPNQYYTITNPRTGRVFPPNSQRVWRFFPETMQDVIERELIIWPDEFEGELERPRYKTYYDPDDTKTKPCSSWLETANTNDREIEEDENEYDIGILKTGLNAEGGRILANLFGEKRFSYPKPLSLIRSIVRASSKNSDWVCDFFAGSGTTGHSVIDLNREDGGGRRYLLGEIGWYFKSLVLPRLKKSAYARTWKDGKPTSRDTGISHCFKYLRLESYEDALGNIAFNENEAAQRQFNFDEYIINYMLAFETGESETLLNIEKLTAPFDYKLEIRDGEESTFKNVDLPETFNFLIGLRVRTRKVLYRTKGRRKLRYLVLRGRTNPHATGGEREVVVIWRTTKDWNKTDFEADKKFVEKNDLTQDADEVFVNSDSFLKEAKSLDPIFKQRMFNEPD